VLSAVPIPDSSIDVGRERVLLEGDIPSSRIRHRVARLHTRYPVAVERKCDVDEPQLEVLAPGYWVGCVSPEVKKLF
jgi:hypothetical protein